MAKAFECDVCCELFSGTPTEISQTMTQKGNTKIIIKAVLYGIIEDDPDPGDETIFQPDVCRHCQVQSMSKLILDYE